MKSCFMLYCNIKSGDLTVSRGLIKKLSRDVMEKESVEKITATPLLQESSFSWATKTNQLQIFHSASVKEIVTAMMIAWYVAIHKFVCCSVSDFF